MGADADELRRRWERLCAAMDAPSGAAHGALERLLAAYTAADRHYHSIDHINECLHEFDGVRALARDAIALELAIWFHDVIYDGRKRDNEEQSARVAEEALAPLGISPARLAIIRRLILLTRHQSPPAGEDIDGQLIVDIDLASLGAPPDVFDENTRLIRLEYPHVQDGEFRRGRRELLSRFLARKRIYCTGWFFDRYERSARENLARAIRNLN